MSSPTQAWRLECNFARAGKTHLAGEVLTDLSAEDLDCLGAMAVPVESADGDNVIPIAPAALSDEQLQACADVEDLISQGIAEKTAIKEIRAGDPALPATKTIRRWLEIYRAPAAGEGE